MTARYKDRKNAPDFPVRTTQACNSRKDEILLKASVDWHVTTTRAQSSQRLLRSPQDKKVNPEGTRTCQNHSCHKVTGRSQPNPMSFPRTPCKPSTRLVPIDVLVGAKQRPPARGHRIHLPPSSSTQKSSSRLDGLECAATPARATCCVHPRTRTPGGLRTLFRSGKSAKKTLPRLIRETADEAAKPGSGSENLEDLHQQECQRSAMQTLSWVQILKTSMITTTTRNSIVNDLLGRQRITLSWEKTL